MMKGIHGSVAKLLNDLRPERLIPFWVDSGHQSYFDGCIRDETQCRRAYQHVLTQTSRHGIGDGVEGYPHIRKGVELERALSRAIELNAFMPKVPYARYQHTKPQNAAKPLGW